MNEITGNAGIGYRFDCCGHLVMKWVGIVVADPGFKQIAKNIQRIGLAGLPAKKRRKPAVIAGSSTQR